MDGIHKTFPGVHALDGVNFELRSGEVHVLLGENGAGKSTLIKILSGALSLDRGEIYIEGRLTTLGDPIHARALGIHTIYQDFTLVPQLTVAENICLGVLPGSRSFVDWKKVKQRAEKTLERMGFGLDLAALVRDISVPEQQLTEIAKALAVEGKVLIFDEPTSALTEDEIVHLFDIIRDLKRQGMGIIYISHRLDEVAQIGDRATVLRNGKYVTTLSITENSTDELISLIIGRDLREKFPRARRAGSDRKILRVQGASHPHGYFRDVSLELHEGEIIGMAGLLGCGTKKFLRALVGLHPDTSVGVEIHGKREKIRSPAEAIESGVFYLPADTKTEGVVLSMSVADNITLASFEQYSTGGFVSSKQQNEDSQTLQERLEIKTASLMTLVRTLSGGNQQKVMMARALCTRAKIFIFDEPTRGIDVGTKVEIYKLINQLLGEGVGVIFTSPELPEIIGMSDRITAWRDGEIIATLDQSEVTEELLLGMISRAEC
jgi:ribose transport system ATP-binding protein